MARSKGHGKGKKASQAKPIEVPSEHDWRTTDAQEIDRRRQRARDERMRIENLTPDHDVFANFRVRSASGRSYEVEVRSFEPAECTCDCVDFQSNGLGTCKHVEAVLLDIRRRHRPLLKRGALVASGRMDVVVDAQAGRLRLRTPAGAKVPAVIRRWFGDDALLGPDADPAEALAELRSAATRIPALRVSMEVGRWLDLGRRRRESHEARREYEARVQSGEWPPQETLVPLLPYQREGMLHLAFKERALLADEMGLGKTIQAIAACALLHRLGLARRVLVVSPASLKAEWEEQIRRFTPLSSLLVYGHHLARKGVYRRCVEGADPPFFILTNYEQAIPDLDVINDVLRPDVVVLDEAQRIKNWDTVTSRRIKQLRSRFAFVLTGTPIENRIDELRSLVDFLDPSVLGPLFRFNREFHVLDDRGRSVGVRNLDVLHERVKPLLLRRRKADVANELPARTDHNRFLKLTPKQRLAYASHEQEVMVLASLAERRPLSQREKDKLQRELAMMRMICDSNYILDPEDRECPKLDEVARILEDAVAEGSKVIVFSEWQRMLELVRDHCIARRIDFAWHTGSVPQQKRREDINRFKQDPACRVFLTTDAGATGLNLQVASIVVNCDLPWNPARLEQRIARAWRKFQTQSVTVFNLISEDTIESRMLETLATKRSIAESVLDRVGDVTSVILRKSSKEVAERLRKLTGQAPSTESPATPASEAKAEPGIESHAVPPQFLGDDPNRGAAPPPRRDLAREFAARLRQRLGPHLVACEQHVPVGGGPARIVVVADHVAHARAPWMDALREEVFAPADVPASSSHVEVIDRASFETIERLVAAGLLQRADTVRRDLLEVASETAVPPPLTAEEEARLRDASAMAGRLLRRAEVLGNADFAEDAVASLREALLPLAVARALRDRRAVPTTLGDLLVGDAAASWGDVRPVVESLVGPSPGLPPGEWHRAHGALAALLG